MKKYAQYLVTHAIDDSVHRWAGGGGAVGAGGTHLRTGVGVAKTQLRLLQASLTQGLNKLGDVHANATENLSDSLVGAASYT